MDGGQIMLTREYLIELLEDLIHNQEVALDKSRHLLDLLKKIEPPLGGDKPGAADESPASGHAGRS